MFRLTSCSIEEPWDDEVQNFAIEPSDLYPINATNEENKKLLLISGGLNQRWERYDCEFFIGSCEQTLQNLTQREDSMDSPNDHAPACCIVPDQYLAVCTAAAAQ